MALITARDRANILVSGISSARIKLSADTDYYYIRYLRDGKIAFTSKDTKDTVQRPSPYDVHMEVSFKSLAVGSAAATYAYHLELLDSIAQSDLDIKILGVNGQYYNSATTGITYPYVGCKWKVVSDADMDSDMYIEYMFDRDWTFAEAAIIHTISAENAPADGASTPGDTLYGMDSISRAMIVPAGIRTINYDSSASYGGDVGAIRKGKFVAELLTEKDSLGRSCGYAVKLDLEAEIMQTDKTDELAKLDDMAGQANYVKVTLVNGGVITLADAMNINWDFRHESDAQDIAFIKLIGSGVIPLSSWDGLWA